MNIGCGESQRVLDGGYREISKVDVVETVAGVAIDGAGDVLFDQCEMLLPKGSSEAIIAELSDGD